MPVRIYALAKELKLDSKELVEICQKAGVQGKGSALASLTDEEAAKVRSYLSGGDKEQAAAPTESESAPAPSRPTAIRREDYIAPAASGKPRTIGAKPEKASPPAKKPPGESAKPPERSTPSIRVAAMPSAPQAPPEQKADEPAPQKPDLKLPADALRASKTSNKPLTEHLRKHEKRRKTDTPTPDQVPAEPTEAPLGSTIRGRRGSAKQSPPAEGLGGREQRQLKRKRVTRARGGDDDYRPIRRRSRMRRPGVNTAAPRKSNATVQLPCSVREFSEAAGVTARDVLGVLLGMGTMATINAQVDHETAELLAVELGVELDLRGPADLEKEVIESFDQRVDAEEDLQPRAPVVTFLGHVDHGKTSLLDRIMSLNVVEGESGGITQHIRAYRVEKDGRAVAFVDTPGHEAFTEMRARGANVTDIAVLVVAADDGVMPQTEEAISHARAAEVPIVVALNKMDLPGVNVQKVLQELSTNELLPTEWGGDTEVVQCSAITGDGVEDLVETLLTIAELHDLKANPERAAYGTSLEAELHEGRGVVSKLLVQKGTLHVGDVIMCGAAFGRVKAMYDTLTPSRKYKEVGPSTPVNVTGLNVAPAAGEHFYVLDDIAQAREIAEKRIEEQRQEDLAVVGEHVTLENLFDRLGEEEVKTLNLILRADVRGSIEAIKKEFTKLEHPEVQIKILQATVGGVTEADVHLADASDAVIIGFNVVPDEGARIMADARGVQIRRYEVIYKVTEDLKAALEGMLKPEERDVDLGRVLVQKLFTISRIGTVAGCRVLSGTVERNARARLVRDSRIIGDYPLDSLRREKDDTREVREGMECGIKLKGYNDIKEGDMFEIYKVEEVARTL